MPDLTPDTGDWHVWNVGLLIAQLQSLEFAARAAIAKMTGSDWGIDFRSVQSGDWVQESPMTNYDQLAVVLKRFNKLASPGTQLDVQRIVDLRDQLAHGRTVAREPAFPLTLLKFGKPVKGRVPVRARIDMTATWFSEQRKLVHEAIQTVAVGSTNRATKKGTSR